MAQAADQTWTMGPNNNNFHATVELTYTASQAGTTWYYNWDMNITGASSGDCLLQRVKVMATRGTCKVQYQWQSATEDVGEVTQKSSTSSMFDIEAAIRTKLNIPSNHTLVYDESNVSVEIGHDTEPVLVCYSNLNETAAYQPEFDVDIGTAGDTTVQTGDKNDHIDFNNSAIVKIVAIGNGGNDVINCDYTNYGAKSWIWPGYGTNGVIGTGDGDDTIYHPLGASYETNYGYLTLGVEHFLTGDAVMWASWPSPDNYN